MLTSFGFEARRMGRQFYNMDGSREHQDVEHNVPFLHFEVKRCEKVETEKWIAQATRDAEGGRLPVVAYRRNKRPWRVVMDGSDFLRIMRLLTILLRKERGAEAPHSRGSLPRVLPLSSPIVADEGVSAWEGEGGSILSYEERGLDP